MVGLSLVLAEQLCSSLLVASLKMVRIESRATLRIPKRTK